MVRIACSNKALLSFVSDFKGVTAVAVQSADLCARLGDADLFLLTDAEARDIAENCQSDSRPTLVVLVNDGDPLPDAFTEGYVDDLLLLPLRPLDVERILQMHAQMQVLHAVEQSSRALPQLVNKLQEDIQLAQKIQRRLIKEKFPPMHGLNINRFFRRGCGCGD